MNWPAPGGADTFARPEGQEPRRLDVFLGEGRLIDVHLDGASVYPTWFKLEFKETGEISAKVKGVRLSTRLGDLITLHTDGAPPAEIQRARNSDTSPSDTQ